jgi:hypothetical protein
MKTTKSNPRRNFLLAAGLGGAGVAAAVVTGTRPVKAGHAAAEAGAEASGYRETDHIRKYYKTTKV